MSFLCKILQITPSPLLFSWKMCAAVVFSVLPRLRPGCFNDPVQVGETKSGDSLKGGSRVWKWLIKIIRDVEMVWNNNQQTHGAPGENCPSVCVWRRTSYNSAILQIKAGHKVENSENQNWQPGLQFQTGNGPWIRVSLKWGIIKLYSIYPCNASNATASPAFW